METIIAIALVALSLFGPGWSSEHKAYWEWRLGRKLEGYEEHRLARGWAPDGNGPLNDSLEAVKWPEGSASEPIDCFPGPENTVICVY